MLLAVTLYMSFVYGLVYLLFEAFPFVFVNVSPLSLPMSTLVGSPLTCRLIISIRAKTV